MKAIPFPRLALLAGAAVSLALAGAAQRRLDARRALEGIDPTVVDVVELEGGTKLSGQVVETDGAGDLVYRLRELEILRPSIRELHRRGEHGTDATEDRVLLAGGGEWSGRIVEFGEDSIALAVEDQVTTIPRGSIRDVRRVHETDVQVFLAGRLGPFRPIAIDVLWSQADDKMRQGRWWELPAIYERISKLQPYNVQVWLFNGWNLAFNVAAQHDTPREQWPWIRQGIEFLAQGARKNPDSWEIPFQVGFVIGQKCGDDPYLQEKVLEIFGTGQTRWRELVAEWTERSRSSPGHLPFVCSLLFQAYYPYLMAEALLDGDEAGYREYRRLAQAALDHHRTAHPYESLDFPPVLPPAGEVLMRMGTRHLGESGGASGAQLERAERYFVLAARRYRDEGDEEMAMLAGVSSEAIARVHEGFRLAERHNLPGARREWRAARDLFEERRLLHYWLPTSLPIGPGTGACQGTAIRFPFFVEQIYALTGDLARR